MEAEFFLLEVWIIRVLSKFGCMHGFFQLANFTFVAGRNNKREWIWLVNFRICQLWPTNLIWKKPVDGKIDFWQEWIAKMRLVFYAETKSISFCDFAFLRVTPSDSFSQWNGTSNRFNYFCHPFLYRAQLDTYLWHALLSNRPANFDPAIQIWASTFRPDKIKCSTCFSRFFHR